MTELTEDQQKYLESFDDIQTIMNFLLWASKQGVVLSKVVESSDKLRHLDRTYEDLLYDYLGIDKDKL